MIATATFTITEDYRPLRNLGLTGSWLVFGLAGLFAIRRRAAAKRLDENGGDVDGGAVSFDNHNARFG